MAIMAETIKPVSFSQTWTFFEGAWHEGNVPIMGPRTHAAWLGSTVFDGCLSIYVAPMPPTSGSAITLSPFRRPTMENAPVDCKAACLYPNNSRALIEAQGRGFNNCLMLDMLGNVAEFGNSNVFMAKDGVVYTPAPNGTFLNGITRQRVIDLLRGDGASVVEATLRYQDFQGADEIFSSGNFAKVAPIIRIDDRSLQPGPFYNRARKLYWEFAHA
jgi:branched-chain amino acid aminotransferase